nr:hypothetical protein [Micromonospora sp. DSM 115978]
MLTEGPETVGYTAGEEPEQDGDPGGNQSADDGPDLEAVAECLGVDPGVFGDRQNIEEWDGAEFTSDFAEYPTVSSESSVAPADVIAERAEVVASP